MKDNLNRRSSNYLAFNGWDRVHKV
jgi:hypothetical protein